MGCLKNKKFLFFVIPAKARIKLLLDPGFLRRSNDMRPWERGTALRLTHLLLGDHEI